MLCCAGCGWADFCAVSCCCCTVICCASLSCCAVLCCAVLCCAVLCCAVPGCISCASEYIHDFAGTCNSNRPDPASVHTDPCASQAKPLVSVLRVLLFGAPADSSMADALTQAALHVCQALPGHSSATPSVPAVAVPPGSLQGLLRVVMWGAASLTHAELADAASQILQLAGQSTDEMTVAELSRHIRQV